MNCQTFSTGLSSGHLGGSGTSVIFGGTMSLSDRCQPAWSKRSTAWAPGATAIAISARCRFIAGDIAARQDKGRALAVLGADGAEDIGRGSALIVWRRGSRTAPGPAPGDLILLSDTGLVGKPHLYRGQIDVLVARELVHNLGEAFLKSSTAPSAWAWWRGWADSLR